MGTPSYRDYKYSTIQEFEWGGKTVMVTGIKSNRGVIHKQYARFVGFEGVVKREAKNGMLIVRFHSTRNGKPYRGNPDWAIPAGGLTVI